MGTIFFLRSYGDFIIALNMARGSDQLDSFSFVVSKHLENLYYSIPTTLLPKEMKVVFYDFNIKHGIMACFTNRHLLSNTSRKELLQFSSFFKRSTQSLSPEPKEPHYFLEQKRRSFLPTLLTGKKFHSIHASGNVYDSYAQFFGSSIQENIVCPATFDGPLLLLIFPGSRKKEKEIPSRVLNYISTLPRRPGVVIKKAILVKEKASKGEKELLEYTDFNELRDLITSADFIISADSLVAHLSQLFGKPHWIMYNKKINIDWITPFARKNYFFCCFSEFKKIGAFLQKEVLI